MAPITKLFNNLMDLITGSFGSFLHAFEKMNMIQLSALAICVVVIALLCMRGSPVHGA